MSKVIEIVDHWDHLRSVMDDAGNLKLVRSGTYFAQLWDAYGGNVELRLQSIPALIAALESLMEDGTK